MRALPRATYVRGECLRKDSQHLAQGLGEDRWLGIIYCHKSCLKSPSPSFLSLITSCLPHPETLFILPLRLLLATTTTLGFLLPSALPPSGVFGSPAARTSATQRPSTTTSVTITSAAKAQIIFASHVSGRIVVPLAQSATTSLVIFEASSPLFWYIPQFTDIFVLSPSAYPSQASRLSSPLRIISLPLQFRLPLLLDL